MRGRRRRPDAARSASIGALVLLCGCASTSAFPSPPIERLSSDPATIARTLSRAALFIVEKDGVRAVNDRAWLFLDLSSDGSSGWYAWGGCAAVYGRFVMTGNQIMPRPERGDLIDCETPPEDMRAPDFIDRGPYRVYAGEGELVLVSARADSRNRWARYRFKEAPPLPPES